MLTKSTTFEELCNDEECYNDNVIDRLQSDPVMLDAVLTSFEEDINSGHLVEGLERNMYSSEYLECLLKLMKLGDKMHTEFASAMFTRGTKDA